ncbi:MAG TPA: site-2 protease family protein [Candidatus Paceibacterota bacterium]|nr:site-2 protease family protein [Candidatus Paceibacterota bacterium]
MTILLFILVLVVLIVVHELGHFFAAKWAGMRVEEFGLGYPPRAAVLAKKHGTEYTLNWLPFGGFVRIYGEDGEGAGKDSFAAKSHLLQAIVLAAGIIMNIVFAWVLISISLGLGMPRALSSAEVAQAPDARLMVSRVVSGSPAEEAGFVVGDVITKAEAGAELFVSADSEAFTAFIGSHPEPLSMQVVRAGETLTLTATPEVGTLPDTPERAALGIGVASVGTVAVPALEAPIEGARMTWELTKDVAIGLIGFFGSIFTLSADLSQVSGPVGIAGAVGNASATGLVALLTLVAVISVNLALINLLPVPALDGGRLLFVLIEAVTRRKIPEKVTGAVNTAGFVFLILLMVLITASDIGKLF